MQNRKAITQTAVVRRIQDSALAQLPERRDRRGRRHRFGSLLTALMLGMMTASGSLRAVEALTHSLSRSIRKKSGIRGRISDSTLRKTLLSLNWREMRACLVRQVNEEHRRGQLKPVGVAFGVVAIDGKAIGTLSQFAHPDIQRAEHEGRVPYGLARVQRAHLISSAANICIDQRPIPGDTNEIGAMGDVLRELIGHYGHTSLFELIMADAGSSSAAVARQIAREQLGYMLRLKSNHGSIFEEARRQFEQRGAPKFEMTCHERGCHITYRLWRLELEGGWMNWESARQVIRVERITTKTDGTRVREGVRMWVTNLHCGRLATPGAWLELTRRYWRCENEGHWTSDELFGEDARRTPWTQDPEAVYVMSFLRMIAQNILAVLRQMVRQGWTQGLKPWREVVLDIELMLRQPVDVAVEAASSR